MDAKILLLLACIVATTVAWSLPFYPVPRVPLRVTRFAPPSPPRRVPIEPADEDDHRHQQRPKRGHDYDHDSGHHRGTGGVTGPVHTFVKTDKNANYKWGVRHHVGDKYAS
ncbi:uncharacterized protein LOC115445664 [Manduca sexta]|uniref:Uncharacterized protein n=1 Tax=Manduca sexta TaxID=7130 RepID=A0A922CPW7_MANSE|nr:uncharacterized protein LOC115445664 [Manduca sexta]KAG6453498.1 hypothetical protein O3G_MSEX008202 [Manduca sexta]KAG6453499.1 hypothetical protein O3G_MSEX008202 [Manduca sexta]